MLWQFAIIVFVVLVVVSSYLISKINPRSGRSLTDDEAVDYLVRHEKFDLYLARAVVENWRKDADEEGRRGHVASLSPDGKRLMFHLPFRNTIQSAD